MKMLMSTALRAGRQGTGAASSKESVEEKVKVNKMSEKVEDGFSVKPTVVRSPSVGGSAGGRERCIKP